jgi:hypothetical protein
VSWPLGDYLDRYAVWLSEQGFCRVHARLQLVQIADFSLWLTKRGLTIINIQPTTIDSFIEDRRRRVKPRAARGYQVSTREPWNKKQPIMISKDAAPIISFPMKNPTIGTVNTA